MIKSSFNNYRVIHVYLYKLAKRTVKVAREPTAKNLSRRNCNWTMVI